MSFEAPYLFKQNNEVIIKGSHGGSLRCRPNEEHRADGNGGTGEFARWFVELHERGIRLRNVKTNKYLRIHEHGKHIDIGGHEQDNESIFKVHHGGEPGVVSLESHHFPGEFVGMRPDGEVFVGKGGDHCVLHFFRQGGGLLSELVITEKPIITSGDEFNAPYLFKVSGRTVVVKAPNGQYLRVSPDDPEHVDANGATGPFARWKIELHDLGQFMLKSEKTGRHLRIYEEEIDCRGDGGKWCLFRYHQLSGNTVKIESVHSHRKFVHAELDGKVRTGAGVVNAEMSFWHQGGSEQFSSLTDPLVETILVDTTQQVVQPTNVQPTFIDPVPQTTFVQTIPQPVPQTQNQVVVEEKIEVKEVIRSPEATAVAKWLEHIGLPQYIEVFLKNGFDRLDSVFKIEESDLKSMNVAIGHIKTILAACGNAIFIGKTVVLRSTHGYFVTAHKPSGNEGKFDHHDKREGASFFVVKDIGDNKIGLECKEFGTYMHLPPPDSGKHVTHGPLEKDSELHFIKLDKPGYYAIKCVSENTYLVLGERKFIGRTILTSYEMGPDTAVELMILE